MIEAVIFDVDGTLVDSVDSHADAWQRAFTEFGIQTDFAAVRAQIGKGGDQLMPVFMTEQDVARRGEEVEAYRVDLFKREYLPRIRCFSGVKDLFVRIRRDGKRIALASSAKADELAAYKRVADIEGLPDAETSSDDAEQSKPHPDIFQAAVARLGIAAERAVVVGDTPFDAEAASKAGIPMIGVLCGGFPEQDLLAAGAAEIFRDPEDLLRNYDRSLIARG